jgi:hypothetical protein
MASTSEASPRTDEACADKTFRPVIPGLRQPGIHSPARSIDCELASASLRRPGMTRTGRSVAFVIMAKALITTVAA